MARVLFWLVAIPFFLVAILFAINNHHDATVNLWPLTATAVAVPVHGLVLLAIFFGFLFGAIVAWLQGGETRARLREAGRRLRAADAEIADLRGRLRDIDQRAQEATIPVPSGFSERAA